MDLQLCRRYLIAAVLVLMLLAISPTIALFVHLPTGSVKYSELLILDSDHRTDNYPFNASSSGTYKVFVVIKNHLGHSSYYRTHLKFRNSTGSLPSTYTAMPSTLPSICQFNSFLKNGETRETAMTFRILETRSEGTLLTVRKLSVNDMPIDLDATSSWNTTRNGYYYHLFFELWLHDTAPGGFSYHNRFVGIWLNLTA